MLAFMTLLYTVFGISKAFLGSKVQIKLQFCVFERHEFLITVPLQPLMVFFKDALVGNHPSLSVPLFFFFTVNVCICLCV